LKQRTRLKLYNLTVPYHHSTHWSSIFHKRLFKPTLVYLLKSNWICFWHSAVTAIYITYRFLKRSPEIRIHTYNDHSKWIGEQLFLTSDSIYWVGNYIEFVLKTFQRSVPRSFCELLKSRWPSIRALYTKGNLASGQYN